MTYTTDENTICTIKIGSEYIKHKIDMATGEWVPVRKYTRKPDIKFTVKIDSGVKAPFWEQYITQTDLLEGGVFSTDATELKISVEAKPTATETRGRKAKSYDNTIVSKALAPCKTLKDAYATFPFLENVLTDVAALHDGSFSMSVNTLFNLIKNLDVVTTASIQSQARVSYSYAAKLYGAVYIASMQVTKKLVELANAVNDYKEHETEMTVDIEQCNIERAEYVKWFKEQQMAGKYKNIVVPE